MPGAAERLRHFWPVHMTPGYPCKLLKAGQATKRAASIVTSRVEDQAEERLLDKPEAKEASAQEEKCKGGAGRYEHREALEALILPRQDVAGPWS